MLGRDDVIGTGKSEEEKRQNFINQVEKLKRIVDGPPVVPQREKLLWVGVDLDGTLATPVWTPSNPTSEIGYPITENVNKIQKLISAGYKVIVHTSRPWTDYEAIENWLNHYSIPFREIQCGKPLYAAYIDDRAINARELSWMP
jgi:hypothetical protein